MPNELEQRVAFLEKENLALKDFVKEGETQIVALKGTLSTYEEFISIEEFADVEKSLESVAVYATLGTPESIKESLTSLSTYEAIATVEEVTEKLSKLDSFEAICTIEEAVEAVEIIGEFGKIGTLESVKQKLDSLSAYESTGMTVESIVAIVEAKKADEAKLVISGLMADCEVTETIACKTLDLFAGNVVEAKEYLAQFKPVQETAPANAAPADLVSSVESADALIGKEIVSTVESNQNKKPATMLSTM